MHRRCTQEYNISQSCDGPCRAEGGPTTWAPDMPRKLPHLTRNMSIALTQTQPLLRIHRRDRRALDKRFLALPTRNRQKQPMNPRPLARRGLRPHVGRPRCLLVGSMPTLAHNSNRCKGAFSPWPKRRLDRGAKPPRPTQIYPTHHPLSGSVPLCTFLHALQGVPLNLCTHTPATPYNASRMSESRQMQLKYACPLAMVTCPPLYDTDLVSVAHRYWPGSFIFLACSTYVSGRINI